MREDRGRGPLPRSSLISYIETPPITSHFISLFLDGDDCLLNPCLNGATCVDGIRQRTCLCVPGWEGTSCELGRCLYYVGHKININFISWTDVWRIYWEWNVFHYKVTVTAGFTFLPYFSFCQTFTQAFPKIEISQLIKLILMDLVFHFHFYRFFVYYLHIWSSHLILKEFV